MSILRSAFLASCLLVPAAASTAFGQPPPDSSGALPFVTRIFTEPAQPNSHQPTSLVLDGVFPHYCGAIEGARVIDPGHVEFTIRDFPVCRDPLPGWRQSFDLGVLAAGRHVVEIAMTHVLARQDSMGQTTVYHGRFQFLVQGDSLPVPPGPLPYVSEILIRAQNNPPPFFPLICPSDSISVRVNGMFPNPCFRLLRVDLLPSPIASPLPEPPIVRFIVDDGACLDRLCPEVMTPWSATVVLPPLPVRDYGLIVQLGKVSCPDTIPSDTSTFQVRVPFRVDSCGPIEPCVAGDWTRGGNDGCNAHIAPNHPAQVTFEVQPEVALAGLQGEFMVHPPQLAVTRIETVGPAAGMHLVWRPTAQGARFALFADHGAPIPPIGRADDSTHVPGPSYPILRLTLEAPGPLRVPVTSVTAGNLLGSDEAGHGVPECRRLTLVVVEARICSERGCDINGDGHADVRDLVVMAHCVIRADSAGSVFRTPCPDSSAVPDCNGDGRRSLEDVICCALRILREPACPDCPADTTHPRPAPNVRATLGAPEFDGNTVRFDIGMEGLSDVGAAVVRFRYPADRYAAVLDLPVENTNWLMLADVASGGTATMGMVRLETSDLIGMPVRPEPTTLRLTLKPGQAHGGAVAIESADFSGPDGAMLGATNSNAVQRIDGRPSLALSEAQPNPFAGTTRFRLTLDRPADVAVGIYDLSGRLVATLHRGSLGAGTHDFAWDGKRDGGASAKSGVYFYRANSSGSKVSRKMVLLGS